MTLQDAITLLDELKEKMLPFAEKIDEIRKAHPAFIKDGQKDIPGACMAYPLILESSIEIPPANITQLGYHIKSINNIIECFDDALKFIKADVKDAYLYDNGLENENIAPEIEKTILQENELYSAVLEVRNEIAHARDQLVTIHDNLTAQKQDTPTKTPE